MNTNPETIELLLARLLDDMQFFGLIKLMPGEGGVHRPLLIVPSPARAMSAFTPKADIRPQNFDVC